MILVLESVIRDGWFAVSEDGSSSQDTDDDEGSVGFPRFPLRISVTIRSPSL